MPAQLIGIVCFYTLLLDILLARACFPPDEPAGGWYFPLREAYLPGDRVTYSCADGLSRSGNEVRACQAVGHWTGATPFCDEPSRLKNPRATPSSLFGEASVLTDSRTDTCYSSPPATGQSILVYLVEPAVLHSVALYFLKGKVNLSVRAGRERNICTVFDRDLEMDEWVRLDCAEGSGRTDFIVLQDISPRSHGLGICEIQVYVKDDVWCKDPPRTFVANGRLQVSRGVASLRCAEGFKPRDSQRLVCERNNTWVGPNLVCDERLCPSRVGESPVPGGDWHIEEGVRKLSAGTHRILKCQPGHYAAGQPDWVVCHKDGSWTPTNATCLKNKTEKTYSLKIIAISVGSVIVLLIFFFFGLTIYLIQKKKTREVVVVLKPGEDGYVTQSLSMTAGEGEYSTVYYDAMRPQMFPPTPSKSPHLSEYSYPVDELTAPSASMVPSNTLPTDIAFATLKSSDLYGI